MEGNIFQQEFNVNVPHADFDLSYENRYTCDLGSLIPVAWYEAMPGDTFRISQQFTVQTMPLQSPAYANLRLYNATFAVPYRLIWSEFEEFMSPSNPANPTPVAPYMALKAPVQPGDLGDYLGIPVGVSSGLGDYNKVSALPLRAYQLIYYEWFQDENFVQYLKPSVSSGLDSTTIQPGISPLQVSWKKDYFTSCLPWAQFGNGAVANLNNGGTGTEVEEIRRANALQRWLEKASAVGHRYIEAIFGHFGVKSRDARLQRPELIGFGSSPLRIDTVLQTSQTSQEDTPTGTRYGTMNSRCEFSLDDGEFFCDEHMIIMTLAFIRPDAVYTQGLSRAWTRWDRFDYPWPEFAHLGDQEILNREIFLTGTSADDGTFGYQTRDADFKYHRNETHGEFLASLAHWAMPRNFSSTPQLNSNFLTVQPNADDNIFAVSASVAPHYLVSCSNIVSANRPLPAFGMPTL